MKFRSTGRLALSLLPILAAVAGCGGNQASDTAGSPATESASRSAGAPSKGSSSGGSSSSGSTSSSSAAAMSGSGYKITPAEGWVDRKSQVGGAADLVLATTPKDGFAANLNVVVVPASAGETLESAKTQLPEAYPKMFTKYTQVGQDDLTVDGTPGFSNTGTYETGTPARKIWMHQAIFLRGGKGYTFTCTSLDADHAEHEADFQAMINSVKWAG